MWASPKSVCGKMILGHGMHPRGREGRLLRSCHRRRFHGGPDGHDVVGLEISTASWIR